MKASIVTNAVLAHDAMGNHARNLASYLEARGYDAHIFYEGQAAEGNHPKFHRTGFQELIASASGKSTPALEHFHSSDLYIYNYGIYYPLVESIRLVRCGLAFFDFHGITPPELSADSPDRSMLDMARSRGYLVHFADYAIVHSAFIREELVRRYGYPQERIYQLPLVVSAEHFSPGERNPRLERALGLAGHAVLLYVGRLVPHKRVARLVETLAQVKERLPRVKLLIIGDNRSPACAPSFQEAKELAHEKGLDEDVLFLGTIVRELRDYYNLADVFVTASLHEGFCLPAVEAMACGVPVVATRAAALPETVGDAGLLFEPGDVGELAEKIAQVLTSPDLRRELSQRGLERAKLFTQERFEERLDEMFERFNRRALPPAIARVRPLPVQALPASLEELRREADIALREYAVRSDKPLVGRFIAWARRNMTSHLKEPYLDPIVERQVSFNFRLLGLVESLQRRVEELERRGQPAEGRETSPPGPPQPGA